MNPLKASDTGPGPTRYRFEEFQLDLREEVLLKNGSKVVLPRRAYQVLALLVRHHGSVVSKDAFFEEVWGGAFVEENNLTVVIRALRKALGDDVKHARFIENLPRKGYRFVATVREVNDAADAKVSDASPVSNWARNSRRLRVALTVAISVALITLMGAVVGFTRFFGPPVPTPKSVVVLPFSTRSESSQYIAGGLTLGIVQQLSRARGLRVIESRSLIELKADRSDASVAAKQLGSDTVVTGQIEEGADALVVYAELIDASTSKVLWQQRFRRRALDLYSIQNEIGEQVARVLDPSIDLSDERIAARRQTQDPTAYELYLRGRHHWNKRTDPDFVRAAELYRQAVDIDPAFAAAYVGLAEAYSLGKFDLSDEERNSFVRGYIDKALEIDDTISEAYAARAINKCYHDWDLAGAESDYLKAIELNPNNATARHWYAELLAMQGRFQESFVEYERAAALDPLSLPIKTDMAFNYFYARDYDTAIELLNKVISQAPEYQRTYLFLSQVYKEKGMFEEAISALEKLYNLKTGSKESRGADSADRTRFLTEVRTAVDNAGARGYWQTEANLGPKDYHLKAVAHAKLGENDMAFEWLEASLRARATGMVWLKVTPDLDGLRSDPRFADLMQRTGLFR